LPALFRRPWQALLLPATANSQTLAARLLEMKRLTEINQKEETNKSERRLKIIYPIIIVFAAVMTSIIVFSKRFDYCDHVKGIKQQQFTGIVIEKTNWKWNHNSHDLKIKTKDGEEYLDLSHDCNTGKENLSILWLRINVGDSILKLRDDFKVQFKENHTTWAQETIVFNNIGRCMD
jgi:hypothetical protein